ncbi:MAG: Fur family transcriptional regulator [Pseudomonadota bacterium]
MDGDDRSDGSTDALTRGSAKDAPSGLGKNEKRVWIAMLENGGPMKAYEILDALKGGGVRAPMTVYRALEGLEGKGLIHKLEGKNAYIICNHDRPHRLQAFLVCEECPTVREIDIDGLEGLLKPYAEEAGFSLASARLELRGRCEEC